MSMTDYQFTMFDERIRQIERDVRGLVVRVNAITPIDQPQPQPAKVRDIFNRLLVLSKQMVVDLSDIDHTDENWFATIRAYGARLNKILADYEALRAYEKGEAQ